MTGRPLVIGHRGAPNAVPENTLPSFARALEAGAEIVEFDVVQTRDGRAVVTHDFCLNPDFVLNPEGARLDCPSSRVRNLTLDDLRRFRIGAPRSGSVAARRHPRQQVMSALTIPRLEETLDLISAQSGARALIEVKSDPTASDDTAAPVAFVETVLEAVDAAGMAERTILQSFDWRVLRIAKAVRPHVARSHLACAAAPGAPPTVYPQSPWLDGHADTALMRDLPAAVVGAGGQILALWHLEVTEDLLARARELGIDVFAWTVNDPAAMQRVLSLGLNGVITDAPDLARALVDEAVR